MGRGDYFRSGRNSVTSALGAAPRRAVRVRAGAYGCVRVQVGGAGSGRPGPRESGNAPAPVRASRGTTPGGAPGQDRIGHAALRRTGASRDRAGRTRSAGPPDRRGQAQPGAGQRPGHSPGTVRRPGVRSRGARSAFADMSRSVSAARAGVNPRPRPPKAPLTSPRAHPAHPVRPALSPMPRPLSPLHPDGRKAWPDFTAPQCGRHAFAGIPARGARAAARRTPHASPGPPGTCPMSPQGTGMIRIERPGPPQGNRHDRGTCPRPPRRPRDAYGR